MKPGATMRPLASKISALRESRESLPGAATSAMLPPSSRISSEASVFDAGSRTRPFLTSSMRGILYIGGAAIARLGRFTGGMRTVFGDAYGKQVEQGHANGDAIGDLLEDAGLRA